MKKVLFIVIFVFIVNSLFCFSIPLKSDNLQQKYCKNPVENELYKCYLKIQKNPIQKNYCDFFKALDKWGYISYFQYSCPGLKKVSKNFYPMLLEQAIKGNRCAIRSYVLSSKICFDEKEKKYLKNSEYLESQYEDFANIARNHLDILFDVLLDCDDMLQKYVLDNLAQYYWGEIMGEYKTKFMRRNIEKLKKENKYRQFINYILRKNYF